MSRHPEVDTMTGDVEIAQPDQRSVVVASEYGTAPVTDEGLLPGFEPQLDPTLVVTLPSDDDVFLQADERVDRMSIGHLPGSWSRCVDN
ncbi:hypothetical protein, partial [Methanoregula sp.]|uniref:hypothetical protein n=1 Tax=Methanoregula sp. TaxID=2052170 RepID=UPI0025E1FFD7